MESDEGLGLNKLCRYLDAQLLSVVIVKIWPLS